MWPGLDSLAVWTTQITWTLDFAIQMKYIISNNWNNRSDFYVLQPQSEQARYLVSVVKVWRFQYHSRSMFVIVVQRQEPRTKKQALCVKLVSHWSQILKHSVNSQVFTQNKNDLKKKYQTTELCFECLIGISKVIAKLWVAVKNLHEMRLKTNKKTHYVKLFGIEIPFRV